MSLSKLIEAVERGEWPGEINGIARAVFPYNEDWRRDHGVMAHEAFDGSLDAAKRLHDALLPGWVWGRTEGNIFVQNPAKNRWHTFWGGPNEVDARNFLLAILRALEEEGRNGWRKRLEIDHFYVLRDGKLVREEGDPGADGIECRDATIALLDDALAAERAKVARLVEALAAIYQITVEPAETDHKNVRGWIEVTARAAITEAGQ